MKPVSLLAFICLLMWSFHLAAQPEQDYVKYNRNLLNPYALGKHQFLFSVNYGLDINYKDKKKGNTGFPGLNTGIGAGYNYRVFFENESRSAAIGAKAEWFPNQAYKFNVIIDFDHGIYAYKKFSSSILICGWEGNITYSLDFKEWETHSILYLLEVKYDQWELKWGMQSWWELFKPTIFLDDTFNVWKLTRRINI